MIGGRLSTSCGSDRFENAAPVVEAVTIADPAGNAHPQSWPGLVDTGADKTAVPLSACEDLGLRPRDWLRPIGFDRNADPRRTPLYYVRLGIPGIGGVLVSAYGVRRPNILLGRDFLSRLVLLIDGEAMDWKASHGGIWTRLVAKLLFLR